MGKLDIGGLEALCAVVDHGGVTRAAVRLALSQSAVSHKIKRMEESLGCNLLDRAGGSSSLTPEGGKLLEYSRRILALREEALLSLTRQPLSGRIRLGMTEDVANSGLARILGRFTRLYPDVAVHTATGQSLHIEARLDRGEIDIGVFQLFGHRTRPSDKVLSRETLLWIKAPDFRLNFQRAIPYLAFDDDCFYRQWASDLAHFQSPGLETVLTCSSTEGILSAVASGLGVTLISQRHLRPSFEVLTEHFPQPPSVAFVLRTAKNLHSRAAMALQRSILEEFDATEGRVGRQ